MQQLVEALERREGTRSLRQLPCKLLVGGHCRPARVRNFAARGLLVEAAEPLPPNGVVVVAFDAPGGQRFVLEASAPRMRPLPHSLAGLRPIGIGLSLTDPPPAYLRWLEATSTSAS